MQRFVESAIVLSKNTQNSDISVKRVFVEVIVVDWVIGKKTNNNLNYKFAFTLILYYTTIHIRERLYSKHIVNLAILEGLELSST